VLPLVLQLAERRELRLQAMTAADAIAPLSDADLAGLLDDPDPDMVLAALAMAGRHDQPPLHAVIGLLAHDDDRVAEAALASLPDRLAADFRAALEQIAKDERPKVATRGWQALLRIPDQTDAATAAITAQPPVTASPTPGDGDAGLPPAPPDTPADTPAAHAALIEQLDAVADETRIAALQGLYVLARPEDGERVLSLLQVANPDAVKKQACLFLGRVQHRPAVRTLIDLLRDSEDPGLKANAFWSLQRITALKLKPDAALWELWWDRAGKEFVTPSPR
ncbi:MAG TPA: HEAT repeat domain-containing protein, partial [Planctomycetota bacterium]|nr:HEAT repeat domain-containing protein [Planctomycetota bacterium]